MEKKNNTPSLDLSYAYGTATVKCLEESADSDATDDASSGDTTIRAITSLFAGKRVISGLGEAVEESAAESSDEVSGTDAGESAERPAE